MIPSRYTNLEAARARFGDRVDRLAPFLLRTDPLADEAVAAMAELPPGQGFAFLEQMLERGDSAGAAAPPALRTFVAEASRVPAWVDWPTIEHAGEVLYRGGALGGLVLGAMALPIGYASPGGNKPLVFSGRLTEQAPRRLNETSRFVQAVCRPGGMQKGADGFNITLKVRIMHANVRRMLLRSGRWDEARWGAPINQHDMVGTTLLFSEILLQGLCRFGMMISHDEAERYMQLWRYVGYLMGVDLELLPCSRLEAQSLGYLIEATQGEPDDDSRALVRALVDSPLAAATNEKERRIAVIRSRLGRGLVRGLVGDELADKLGVGPTPWQSAMRLFRTAGAIGDKAARFSPFARRKAVASGEKYWETVIERGLKGGPYDFRPQERLSS